MINMVIPKFRNDDEYCTFINCADDKENLNESLVEYEAKTAILANTMSSNGTNVRREYINIADMIRWLKSKNLPNIGPNRAKYYVEIALAFTRN
jgi:hypothetical protein